MGEHKHDLTIMFSSSFSIVTLFVALSLEPMFYFVYITPKNV